MNQEDITIQAKKIMDNFVKLLNQVKVKEKFGTEREQFLREKLTKEQDKDFQNKILKNAPKTKGNYIVAEKKSW